jgi:glycosyltransferase involved in cell wall biosynthesis
MFKDYVKQYGKPDILHAHCCKWAGYAAMLISKEYDIPYVITEHLSSMLYEKEFGKAPSSAWQIPLLKQAYEQANMVITVSDELVDDIACYFGKGYKHQTISNIIDTDYFCYKEREPLKERSFRFCMLANYWHIKGYDVIIPAMSMLDNKAIELHIAGKNTSSNELSTLIKNKAPEANIIVHGELDKKGVRDLLYQSDCLILPSRSEVQPLCILEAMSSGIPYISTEITPQNLRLSTDCKIVPVGDINALSTAMKQMIEQYSAVNFKQLSTLANNIASHDIVGKQLNELFQQLI